MKKLILSILLSSSCAFAQSGEELYNTYCSACHSPDGNGASNGLFPPLANSEWVQGKADRMVQVILHGLEGLISVKGKDYNLVMPPQGDALTDEQIASISTYVRSSWGNKDSAVTPEFIKKQRQLTAGQEGMWTPRKISRRYPIKSKKQKPKGINDLLSYAHEGAFDSLAELRASEADNVEEEKGGHISTHQGGEKNQAFGIVWEGWLEASQQGEFTFQLNTDHGGALTINGKEVITRDKNTPKEAKPISKAVVQLNKGRFDIKVEYYHRKSPLILDLIWKGPGVPKTSLSYKKPVTASKNIILKPEKGQAIIHRDFLAKTDPRGIAVGYSEGLNLIFSADSMNLDSLWKGDFVNVGKTWNNRGTGKVVPLSKKTTELGKKSPIQELSTPEAPWSERGGISMRFKGYKVNEMNQPTFNYESEHYKFKDELTPSPDGQQMMRTISITQNSKEKPSLTQYFRVFDKAPLSKHTKHLVDLTEHISVKTTGDQSAMLARNSDVLIPIDLEQNGDQVIKINYIFK